MFDKGDVEEIGLVKFDFLGLRNLTIIEMAQNFIRQTTGEQVDVSHIPLDDQVAYKIFRDANTTAVFQFESSGMKKCWRKPIPPIWKKSSPLCRCTAPAPWT